MIGPHLQCSASDHKGHAAKTFKNPIDECSSIRRTQVAVEKAHSSNLVQARIEHLLSASLSFLHTPAWGISVALRYNSPASTSNPISPNGCQGWISIFLLHAFNSAKVSAKAEADL